MQRPHSQFYESVFKTLISSMIMHLLLRVLIAGLYTSLWLRATDIGAREVCWKGPHVTSMIEVDAMTS